mmetsp:Transcript_9311/g.34138  ORF Transcript_9311/g.34138 Transcript_9311/m.34138 type:complete len:596 (-) Transcript_9311:1192-2979(-)
MWSYYAYRRSYRLPPNQVEAVRDLFRHERAVCGGVRFEEINEEDFLDLHNEALLRYEQSMAIARTRDAERQRIHAECEAITKAGLSEVSSYEACGAQAREADESDNLADNPTNASYEVNFMGVEFRLQSSVGASADVLCTPASMRISSDELDPGYYSYGSRDVIEELRFLRRSKLISNSEITMAFLMFERHCFETGLPSRWPALIQDMVNPAQLGALFWTDTELSYLQGTYAVRQRGAWLLMLIKQYQEFTTKLKLSPKSNVFPDSMFDQEWFVWAWAMLRTHGRRQTIREGGDGREKGSIVELPDRVILPLLFYVKEIWPDCNECPELVHSYDSDMLCIRSAVPMRKDSVLRMREHEKVVANHLLLRPIPIRAFLVQSNQITLNQPISLRTADPLYRAKYDVLIEYKMLHFDTVRLEQRHDHVHILSRHGPWMRLIGLARIVEVDMINDRSLHNLLDDKRIKEVLRKAFCGWSASSLQVVHESNELPFFLDSALVPDFASCGISARNEFQALSTIRNVLMSALEEMAPGEQALENVPVTSELSKLRQAQAAIYLESEIETIQLALDAVEKMFRNIWKYVYTGNEDNDAAMRTTL